MVSEKEGEVSIFLAKMRVNLKLAIYFLAIFFIWNTAVSSAVAASLYLSPSSGSKQVGNNFTVSVFVSSVDQAMNAASGVLNVSNENLEVVSISKAGSIFSLWAQEPTFTARSVNFEGIVLNPGYTGSSGKLITVTLKPKAIGTGSVNFSSGSVLANDGNGTNILTGLGSANFALNIPSLAPSAGESTSPLEKPGAPQAPIISSPTHPNPEKWYSGNNPKFVWSMGSDITGVSIYGDHNPNTNPGSVSDGNFSSHIYSNVEDGVWYFHLRLRNRYGWGTIAHYKFQVDTVRPDVFKISEVARDDASDPFVSFSFKAHDALSGVDNFEVQIDNDQPQKISENTFKSSHLSPGKHILVAKVFDKAGNFLVDSAEFIVMEINPPALDELPTQLVTGEILKISGKTYTNSSVTIWSQFESAEPISITMNSDSRGNFSTVFQDKLREGVYKIWAEVVREDGARSKISNKVSVAVNQRAILRLGSLIISYLAVVVSLLALIFMLIAIVWYFGYKFKHLKNKLKRDIEMTSKSIHEQFDQLRYDILVQVEILEKVKTKRKLTKEEERILSQLKKNLNNAEATIHKELEDLEKEVK